MNYTISNLTDKLNKYYETQEVMYTNFFDPSELLNSRGVLKNAPYIFFGGYETAERNIIFITDEENLDFNKYISAVKILSNKKLDHRSVLGSLLGLGIKREMIGDILIGEFSQVLLAKNIEEYVLVNLKKVGNENVLVEKINLSELIIPEKETKVITTTVPSLRVDALISATYGISREKSTIHIKSEDVKLNYTVIKSAAKCASEGDIISVKRKGRFIVSQIISITKSGRLKIKIEKFI